MRLRIWMLWGVLVSLFGLPAVGIAQVDDAPSLEGVIDIHAHVAPETSLLNYKRAFDAIEAAQIARISGMRGIVLKEHNTETASWAYLVSQMVPDVEVFGGIVLQLIPVHKDIFFLGRDGAFIQMHDKGKFDAVDGAENRRVRMNVKIPRLPLVTVPIDVVSVGIDDISLADIVVAVGFQDHLDIRLNAVMDIEFNFSPANIKDIVKIIDAGEIAAKVGM